MVYIKAFKLVQDLCSAQIYMMKYCTEPNKELNKYLKFI